MIRHRLSAAALAFTLLLAACGGTDSLASSIELVSPSAAAEVVDDAPDGLVLLDVRTADEYDDGHLTGAINVDFYADDFEAQLAQLDRSVPYILYCRSGNRSGQTAPLMRELGFQQVYEVEGGILAWADSGGSIER